MESMQSLLAGRGMIQPPEVKLIQDFVEQKFKTIPQVTVSEKQIVIGVKSSALAGALRPMLYQIQELCNTDKRLLIRIQ